MASLPCIFGFNLWRNFQPLGKESTVLDLEDFIVSDNLLPLGAIYLLIFSFSGWGKEKLFAEFNSGRGWKISPKCAFYFRWIIPLGVFALWAVGMIRKFS